ncbi:MAG: hypothetical protein Q9220_001294 [cf. Caloplaca sp. 1 TL-2023]
MAARSRLALRSSGRRSVGLDETPATAPVNTKKRPHLPSNPYDGDNPTKRPRNGETSVERPTVTFNAHSNPDAGNATDIALNEPVTPIAVGARNPPIVVQQPPHDPTIINPGHSPIETPKPPSVNKTDKRSLRSHDGGSRFKSELASYFADYDEILSDEPQTQDTLTLKSCIHIVDKSSKASIAEKSSSNVPERRASDKQHCTPADGVALDDNTHVSGGNSGQSFRPQTAETLDFSAAERHARHIVEDPLADEIFYKAHRRAERGEKSHRNREKESAQHEQSQLERILDELNGHAWLKTLGITGVTDSEKRIYEPKRIIFIRRITILLDKFKAWKEEEKRRKAERERLWMSDEEEAEEEEEGDEEEKESVSNDDKSFPAANAARERGSLTQRKRSSSKAKGYRSRDASTAPMKKPVASKINRLSLLKALPPPVEKPFTSFYAKPYLREAALSRNRRGRLRFAFGQQIPDLEEREFELPSGMLTTGVLAANARSRRAAKRESKDQ